MFAIYAKSSGSVYFKISTERSITYIAESINKAHMATRTVTMVLKNVVQPCRCPFTGGWFLGHTGGTENVVGSKFSDLASIIAQVKDKKVGVCLDTCKPAIYFIVSHFDEFLYKFCLCSGMWPRVDLVKPSTNSLTYRVMISGRRRAGSTLSSTLLMNRQLNQGTIFSATSTSF